MAREIREFAVLVPAGTPKAAPLTQSIAFPQRVVTSLSWRVPPGPSGHLGWALTSAGTPVIPIQPGVYIVTDNQSASWDLEGYLDSGNWSVTAYNTGVYDHTVYLTFELDFPGAVAISSPPPPGNATGIVGATGTVITPPPSQTGPGASSPPSLADPGPVIAAVIALIIAQQSPARG